MMPLWKLMLLTLVYTLGGFVLLVGLMMLLGWAVQR